MYEAGIRYILGLNIEGNILRLSPCIPSNWNEYKIRFKFGNSVYNIKVINKSGKNTGINKIYLDGVEIEDKQILLENTGKIYSVEVQMY